MYGSISVDYYNKKIKMFLFLSFSDIVDDFTSKNADEGILPNVVLSNCLFISQT